MPMVTQLGGGMQRGGRGVGGKGESQNGIEGRIRHSSSGREGYAELDQTTCARSMRGVCGPFPIKALSHAPHARRGNKPLEDLMVEFRGAREEGAMIFVGCVRISQEDTVEGSLWRETLCRKEPECGRTSRGDVPW